VTPGDVEAVESVLDRLDHCGLKGKMLRCFFAARNPTSGCPS
jgi:hypothetical protein